MVHDAAAAELIPAPHIYAGIPVHESRHSDDFRELSRWLSAQRCAVLNCAFDDHIDVFTTTLYSDDFVSQLLHCTGNSNVSA